jgi:pimeloyl-ACP methyl ester carboxylesterase
MKAAVAPLKRASVAATFVELLGAKHGDMGEAPERTMDAALDFVDEL